MSALHYCLPSLRLFCTLLAPPPIIPPRYGSIDSFSSYRADVPLRYSPSSMHSPLSRTLLTHHPRSGVFFSSRAIDLVARLPSPLPLVLHTLSSPARVRCCRYAVSYPALFTIFTTLRSPFSSASQLRLSTLPSYQLPDFDFESSTRVGFRLLSYQDLRARTILFLSIPPSPPLLHDWRTRCLRVRSDQPTDRQTYQQLCQSQGTL